MPGAPILTRHRMDCHAARRKIIVKQREPQMTKSRAIKDIKDYHAHIYYDPATSRDRAARLRERVGAEFPQAKLGRWHDELVGPHPQSMYQVAFPTGMLADFV